MGLLTRIIFVSTTSACISRADVEELTCWSQDGEVQNFVLYDGKNLIGALQGEEQQTRETFSRISSNPHHFNVNVLIEQAVEADDEFGTDLVYMDTLDSTTVDRKYLMRLIRTLNSQPSSDGGTLMDVLSGFIGNK